ncbi:uncharacterized protein LOC113778313 [Coffea eugenioides]|uniref:uncharacterized protein LOC113778313 n=1 Tax=Coffea eugenioides TaxID=49369 RepID=UPI000F5C689D|nr:uncharacterized protein LOC113701480 [Coffea arabica]XP_027179477.1 uncharacterized protein LOC113778313 [Coffea eugenioides]
MGNCQAAEAATVVIQHPGNKVERIYWSVSAHEVMSSNPGHYVALVISSSTATRSENGTPVKQLKLLRPDDSLLMGQVYRLVSFEDVLKEFAAKKSVKLGKLLKESGGLVLDTKTNLSAPTPNSNSRPRLVNGNSSLIKGAHEGYGAGSSSSSGMGSNSGSSSNRGVGRHHIGHVGQWKPALQSIAEIGT